MKILNETINVDDILDCTAHVEHVEAHIQLKNDECYILVKTLELLKMIKSNEWHITESMQVMHDGEVLSVPHKVKPESLLENEYIFFWALENGIKYKIK